MASPTSPCAPSSSAVMIPTPGKSILKRPPPAQQSFFSRISKFLPTQNQPQLTSGDEARALKRAHFILPELVTVYPISAANPPSTPTLKEEKRSIEQREAERRRRVVRGSSVSQGGDTDEWWSLEKVESFYRECCASRDEPPNQEISAAFKVIDCPLSLNASDRLPECHKDITSHRRLLWRSAEPYLGRNTLRRIHYRMGLTQIDVQRVCLRRPGPLHAHFTRSIGLIFVHRY
jgi:hypothetical protein